jgi:hypothetical protein
MSRGGSKTAGTRLGLLATLLTLGLAWGPDPTRAQIWNEPERVTHNTVEDRTTSGSLIYPCYGEAYAVWMQEQPGLGWQIMTAERRFFTGWSEPEPIDPGNHPDFAPRVGLGNDVRAVWQRNTGAASEIIFAETDSGGPWNVEMVTTNATEDLNPDLPPYANFSEPKHIVWAGFDTESQSGKIFHAVDAGNGWQIERLDGSELGPFWTGAVPRIDVSSQGIVHVVYRGGDFGNYHLHYARKEGSTWTYQVLTSGNINDFSVDVWGRGGPVVVAMSGNDGFGLPSRSYLRRSNDGGRSFEPPELISGIFSATLDNLIAGVNGLAVAASEVSGNIYTGNLLYWLEGGTPGLLPPLNMASERPTAGQIACIPLIESAGDQSVLYVNHDGAGRDSAEVYFLATPGPSMGIEIDGSPNAGPPVLSARIAPNPFSVSVRIDVASREPLDPATHRATVYDVSGRLVRRLTSDGSAGTATGPSFIWDGMTRGGAAAPAGVYILTMEGDGQRLSRRLVRVR